MKKAFNFYASYDEVFQELDLNQKGIMINAILDVQFLRKHIDDISFKDKILSIVWKGMKHSILKQIDGYCRANKTPYNRELFAPKADFQPSPKADFQPSPKQVQVQVQEEEQEPIVQTKSLDASFKIAEYLLNNILKLNTSFKRPNLNTWAKDIDKAIRIDNRTEEQLKYCIDWIYSHEGSFWQKNILSGKKLREKFDTINMQMITKDNSQTSGNIICNW